MHTIKITYETTGLLSDKAQLIERNNLQEALEDLQKMEFGETRIVLHSHIDGVDMVPHSIARITSSDLKGEMPWNK